uniref:proline and serine-rich protein 3 isoform X2 n=1 Tax=Monopterus albus TaxID=43700 RepID=UPI0009B4C045|nr:proline and serine-rich protein 3 isoform X2 [Monopterus albus]
MKSSGPVFTRQNPFQPASNVRKAHYHPSCNQALSKKKKETILSPVRSHQRPSPKVQPLTAEGHQLFEKREQCFAATDGQPVYAESWPSTDSGSSPSGTATSSDMETPKQSVRAREYTGDQQDSVLAKYIDRFRRGQPQSREERQQMASVMGEEQLPFWWMSPSSLPPSSMPTKATDKEAIQPLRDDQRPAIFSPAGQCQHDGSLSPCRASAFMFSDTSQDEFDDTEILHLQERANRLLLRGESTLSDGSIPVSSEGLRCSDFSSPVSVDEPVRRPLLPSLIKPTAAKASTESLQAVSSQKYVSSSLMPSTRPEEDILFQWRLRRKMEQARKWSVQHSSLHDATFSWQAPRLSHLSASGQAYKQPQSNQPPEFSQKATDPHISAPQVHGSCPPASGLPPLPAFVASGSSVCQPQTIAYIPPHMHLLCDVLPCPIQSSHVGVQDNTSQTLDESQAKVIHKKTEVPANSNDEPTHEHVSSSPPASSAAIGEWPSQHKISKRYKKEKAPPTESEKKENKTMTSVRKQKKSSRYTVDREHPGGRNSTNWSSSHQRFSKTAIPGAEQHQRQGSQFPSESCTGDHAPPPSPVHSALGQIQMKRNLKTTLYYKSFVNRENG